MKLALAGAGKMFTTTNYHGRTKLRSWVTTSLWITVAVLSICGLVFGIVSACRSANAASCRNFAEHSGYPSGFHIQHFLGSGTCYVQLPNGHALPQKMVVAYLKAG